MMALTAAILIGYAPTTTADEADHPEPGEALLILVPLEPEANDEEIAFYDVDTETGESEWQKYLASTGMEEADLKELELAGYTGTEGEYPKELPENPEGFEYGFEIGETIPNKGNDQDSDFPETGEREVADKPVQKQICKVGGYQLLYEGTIADGNAKFLDKEGPISKLAKDSMVYLNDKYAKQKMTFKPFVNMGKQEAFNLKFKDKGGKEWKAGSLKTVAFYVGIVVQFSGECDFYSSETFSTAHLVAGKRVNEKVVKNELRKVEDGGIWTVSTLRNPKAGFTGAMIVADAATVHSAIGISGSENEIKHNIYSYKTGTKIPVGLITLWHKYTIDANGKFSWKWGKKK